MTTDSPVTKTVAQIENTKLKVQTPYEKVCDDINNDEGYAQDLAQGKRIGFYSLREDLGRGNFSRVKMGVHTLTKGILT